MSDQSWRDVLRQALSDAKKRKQVAAAMQVHLKTLERWMRDETSKPSSMNLNQLLVALPDKREELVLLLQQEFPDFKPLLHPDPTLSEISVGFYARILEAYATIAETRRFWTLSTLILQQLLNHLERDSHAGTQIVIVRCTHSLNEQEPVRSLYEGIAIGTPPFSRAVELRAYLLGSESLAGYVIAAGTPAVVQDAQQEYPHIPVHWSEMEQSAAGFPILSADRIAGCLRVSTTQPHFFSHRIQMLLHYFSRMLALAFHPEDFYEHERISLDPMPYYKLQDPVLMTLHARISAHVRTGLNYEQAERLARLEIEEELRRMAPTSPRFGENDAQEDQSDRRQP